MQEQQAGQDTPLPDKADPDRFVNDVVAAAILCLSPSYLRQLRIRGGGPRFGSFGRAIRYRVSDLFAWAESKSATSTSERDAGAEAA